MTENPIKHALHVIHTMELSKEAPLDTASSICLYYNRISKIPVTAA